MYRIVITKEEEKQVTTSEWKQLYDTDEQATAHGKDSMYGYAERSDVKTVSIDVLDQRVEDLDMAAVIKAVNKLQ